MEEKIVSLLRRTHKPNRENTQQADDKLFQTQQQLRSRLVLNIFYYDFNLNKM